MRFGFLPSKAALIEPFKKLIVPLNCVLKMYYISTVLDYLMKPEPHWLFWNFILPL